ncbi:MAG TPA: methyltransferase domain-containing protein [Vicinamibacterales bacterium]|nr:methyltransferase domain-containing protein [Vicinamibacterales bacterium]
MSGTRRPSLLLVLADCQGEPSVRQALAEVPAEVFARRDVEALAFFGDREGAARDEGRGSKPPPAPPCPLTVLPGSAVRGYGGARKAGFALALERGFDAVALLNGPAPESPAWLPGLLTPLDSGRAQAVFASRARSAGNTRPGLFTRIHNRLIGARVLDYRSVCRVYAASALGRIPFRLNSDGPAFDTEVLIQLLSAGLRVEDVPVAARSGRMGSREAGGIRYAWDVLRTGLRARAQHWSLFYDRKFDCIPSSESNAHYKPRLGFESAHTLALARVPPGARVLDIGCAGGYLGQALRARGCRVTGIDRLPLDPGCELDAFSTCDFNERPFPADLAGIDIAVMLDVIEHLASPEAFVDDFIAASARHPGVTLIASTGNVAFAPIRLMLLAGQFNYGKRGILDLTHTRLFTFGTFRRLFEQAGFEVLELRGVPAPFPLALGPGRLARALLGINKTLIRISRSLFAFQILAVVRPRAAVAHLSGRPRAQAEPLPRAATAAAGGSRNDA